MHPHTVDWLRNVEIAADSALAQKRWDLGRKYASEITRHRVIELLTLFLFPRPDHTLVTKLTDELLALDPDFPVSGNVEELRVMAGIVMATTFEDSSHPADAFAMGLRAARMGGSRAKPAMAAIIEEAENYLLREAARQRPNDFSTREDGYVEKLVKTYDAMRQAETAGADSVAQKSRAYHAAVADQAVGAHVRQLAEETQLLWWVVGEYSPTLRTPTAGLSCAGYALVAAAEAAARALILPVPPAIDALLLRVLASCKGPRKKATLVELLDLADAGWRQQQVAKTNCADCRPLVPLCAALEKMQELDNAEHAAQAAARLCPGIKADLSLTPGAAARQYFAELTFVAALALC